MIEIRRDAEVYSQDLGWVRSRFHFSFDRYHDPDQMGVGALRVFNDDWIAAGAEWPMHPHRDIESNTYVVSGRFRHADSLGNGGEFDAGAAQVMRFSSRGAQHSEKNGSDDDPTRFIQFWVMPSQKGLESSVQQRQYTLKDRTDRWLTIMSPAGEAGLDLAQDARAMASHLTSGGPTLTHEFEPGRGGYLYVIDGAVEFESDGATKLVTGDAVKVTAGDVSVSLTATDDAELILVDVPLEFEPIGVWRGMR